MKKIAAFTVVLIFLSINAFAGHNCGTKAHWNGKQCVPKNGG